MEVIKFFEELKRMCQSHTFCKNCPLKLKFYDCPYDKNFEDVASDLGKEELIKIIEIVDKWSKEHPAKTRQSEFLKMFPEASLRDGKIIDICPLLLDRKYKKGDECSASSCLECMKDFWLKEIE